VSPFNQELYERKAGLCKTFADPKRLMIMEALDEGERSVGELAELIGVPHAVASRHLAVLRERGVVTSRREGTTVFYRLTDRRIAQACRLVQEVLMGLMERNRDLAEKIMRA